MNEQYKTVYQAKKAGKKVLATGFGLASMFIRAKKRNFTDNNSCLIVKQPNNLDSQWWIVSK